MPSEDLIQQVALYPEDWICDSTLKHGKVETFRQGKLGLQKPRRWGGQFAVVHKFKLNGNFFAYRFFTKDDVGDAAIRYEAIDDNLKRYESHFTRAGLSRQPWVSFDYFSEAYQTAESDEKKYSLIRLDWCGETTLIDFLIKTCKSTHTQTRQQGADTLETVCREFSMILSVMHDIGMAHGDLSAGNIMVEDDHLVLIDYDGMYFPDDRLRQHPSHEKGNPKFQHPNAVSERKYDERMDDFSAFVILLALMALKAELVAQCKVQSISKHSLAHHLDKRDDGTILFRPEDLQEPKHSLVFGKLRKIGDPTVQKLLAIVEQACKGPIDQVPPFAPTIKKLIDPTITLRALIAAQKQDWKAIYHEAKRLTNDNVPLPNEPDLQKLVADVTERYEAYEQLKEAVSQSPTSANLITDKAAKALRQDTQEWEDEIERAQQQTIKLRELENIEKQDPGYRQVIQTWLQCKNLLAGCVEAGKWKDLFDIWQPRIEACDTLLPLIQASRPWKSDIAVADASDQLQAAGGHPDFDAVSSSMTSAIQACGKRRDCLLRVREVLAETATTELSVREDGTFGEPDHSDEDADRRLMNAWNKEYLEDCPDVSWRENSQFSAAGQRITTLQQLSDLADNLDTNGIGSEQELIAATKTLPDDYEHRWRERIACATSRIDTETELNEALQQPISDIRLSEAGHAFEIAWQDAGHRTQWDHDDEARIDRAYSRSERLASLQTILHPVSNEFELDEHTDRALAHYWDQTLFQEPPGSSDVCSDAAVISVRVQHAIERLAAVDQIRHAIVQVDNIRNTHRKPEWANTEEHTDGESLIVEAVRKSALTKRYLESLEQDTHTHIANARQRTELTIELKTLIANCPQSEKGIASAWEQLEAAGGDPAALIDKERSMLAIKRRDGLKSLEVVVEKREADDQTDKALLPIWKTHDLIGSNDAKQYRKRIDLARRRTEDWPKLETALNEAEFNPQRDFDIDELYDRELLESYPPVVKRIDEIEEVIQRSKRAALLAEPLEGDDTPENRELFAERFCIDSIEKYPKKFESLLSRIKSWKSALFEQYRFDHNTRYTLDYETPTSVRVHWSWRGATPELEQIIRSAIVGAGNDGPLKDPSRATSQTQVLEDAYRDENSSALLSIPPGLRGILYVSIWPEISFTLGDTQTLIGPPLQLEQNWPPPQEQNSNAKKITPDDSFAGKLTKAIFKMNDE